MAAAQERPFVNNLVWLSAADRRRIHLLPPGPGRYYLFGYRCWAGPPPLARSRELHTVRADGLTILSVLYTPSRQPDPAKLP